MKAIYGTLAAVMASAPLFADEAAQTVKRGGNFSQTLMMIGIALAFFYFIILRPERRRRKQAEQRRNSLQKGDRITAMGIIGTVVRVQEETVIVKLYDGAKMEILKAAISDVRANGVATNGVQEEPVEVASDAN